MRSRLTAILFIAAAITSLFCCEAQVRVGIMRNAYNCHSRFTNQIAYDWENDLYTVIFRGGPWEEYPDEGNGSLVLASSVFGATWKSDTGIFNADLPSNIPGMRLAARHPSIIAYPDGMSTGIGAIWGQFVATQMIQDGVLGEIAHKAGNRYGPFSPGVLPSNTSLQNFPSRIVRSNDGTMYSMFQSKTPDTGTPTGDFFMMKSSDAGASWNVNYATPALDHASLPAGYVFSEEAISFDASPDGSVIYTGFVAYVPVSDTAQVTDTYFGWVRSTNQGEGWTEPKLYKLPEIVQYISGFDATHGWIYPSIATVVDGLNQPHFLCSIKGEATASWYDSTYVGELIIDPEQSNVPPNFNRLARHILPEFHRKINPGGKTTGPQPVFIIRGEHEWSKSPNGMELVAKWIDADSVWVTTPAGHPQTMARDTAHDVYAIYGTPGIRRVEWLTHEGIQYAIHNVTSTKAIDEKFTKMQPVFPAGNWYEANIGVIFTIMATGEIVGPGQINPDVDDTGPAELFFVKTSIPTGIDGTPAIPNGITLSQNYPNPFNPTTTISFTVANAGHVTVKVLNLLGQQVGIAFDGFAEAGTHSVAYSAANLPSGQYVYRLECNGYTTSRIMTLIK